jgi:hypothetical protein
VWAIALQLYAKKEYLVSSSCQWLCHNVGKVVFTSDMGEVQDPLFMEVAGVFVLHIDMLHS